MSSPPDPRRASRELHVALGLLMRRARDRTGGQGLTLSETAALARLDELGSATSADLARAERIKPQSMGATIAALENRGLVRRQPDPMDARRSCLSMTAEGRRALQGIGDDQVDRLREVLMQLTPDELSDLDRAAPLLRRVAERL